MDEIKYCRKCGGELTDDNWLLSRRNGNRKICKLCEHEYHKQYVIDHKDEIREYKKQYAIDHKDEIREKDRKYYIDHREHEIERTKKHHRNNGGRSAHDNKECASHLGMIAEDVLSKVFKNVIRMSNNNPGYDFICGGGYKIDVKSSCRSKRKNRSDKWSFGIRNNISADFFICLAFDDRYNITPEHIWLIPGRDVSHLSQVSISESKLEKWNHYKIDKLDQIITCCDIMRK